MKLKRAPQKILEKLKSFAKDFWEYIKERMPYVPH